MWRKLLKMAGFAAYLGILAILFVFAGYTSFNLFVRSGATPAPEIVGLSRDEARAALGDAGLRVVIEDGGRFDDEIETGHVLQQSPSARVLVKRGSVVQVVLSLGPQRLKVPDLTGQSLQSAQVNVAAAGLAIGRTATVFRAGAAPGSVAGQSPPAGAEAPPGAPIDLLIARGSARGAYVMPELTYRDADEVRRFFERRGFRIGTIKFEDYAGLAQGVILRQFPLAGHPLQSGDTISLVVSAGAENSPWEVR